MHAPVFMKHAQEIESTRGSTGYYQPGWLFTIFVSVRAQVATMNKLVSGV